MPSSRELYARRRSEAGTPRAQLWYWGTTMSFAAGIQPLRLTEAFAHAVGRDRVPSALDFKLGARMLGKHPGLALSQRTA